MTVTIYIPGWMTKTGDKIVEETNLLKEREGVFWQFSSDGIRLILRLREGGENVKSF